MLARVGKRLAEGRLPAEPVAEDVKHAVASFDRADRLAFADVLLEANELELLHILIGRTSTEEDGDRRDTRETSNKMHRQPIVRGIEVIKCHKVLAVVFNPLERMASSISCDLIARPTNLQPLPPRTPLKTPRYEITKDVQVIDEALPISDAVTLMNSKNISSLLIKNSRDVIVGILTERDLARRLVLLDMADKLTRGVGTIATRDLHFADADRLHESIVKLHFDKGLRHFPVLKGKEPTMHNLIGMLTVTDLLRHYLREESKRVAFATATTEDPLPKRVAVLTARPAGIKLYEDRLSGPTVLPVRITNVAHFVNAHVKGEMPLILDMDGWPRAALSNNIVQAKKYKGQLIMTVSNPDVVKLFRKFLTRGRQTIVDKPFDADYLVWLLTAASVAG